eukprot:3074192-Rhodomonas_salina.2
MMSFCPHPPPDLGCLQAALHGADRHTDTQRVQTDRHTHRHTHTHKGQTDRPYNTTDPVIYHKNAG